jgi:signal transduction histidine kinase
MNLRRLQIVVTAMVAVATLVVSGLLAIAGYRIGTNHVRRETERHAEAQLAEVLVALQRGEKPKDNPSWYVRADGSTEAYSESGADPPFRSMLQAVTGPEASARTEASQTFARGDERFFALIRPVAANAGVLTVVDLRFEDDRRSSLRNRFAAAVLLMTAIAAGAAWYLVTRALAPARRALVERRGFLADAAHEMRTPLAVIQASASQALSRPRSSEEYVRSLAEIRAAAERASTGVNELLDLARLESGQAIPRLAPLRLDLLAEEVAASTRVDGVEVSADAGPAVVVDADMALLRQAIDNVVRNAARRATHVRLESRVEGRDGVLVVLDDGPGFDPAALPHVFDRFKRGDSRGEVGLGLALVQAIVAAHGGAAGADNRPEGGAAVTLRVPLSRAALT